MFLLFKMKSPSFTAWRNTGHREGELVKTGVHATYGLLPVHTSTAVLNHCLKLPGHTEAQLLKRRMLVCTTVHCGHVHTQNSERREHGHVGRRVITGIPFCWTNEAKNVRRVWCPNCREREYRGRRSLTPKQRARNVIHGDSVKPPAARQQPIRGPGPDVMWS